MMLYALGALNTFYFIYGDTIHTVHFSIVQPNAGGVKEWECQVKDLAEWGETVVRPAAELAWTGKGEFVPGDWCRFCKAKAQCSARAKVMLELGDVPHAWSRQIPLARCSRTASWETPSPGGVPWLPGSPTWRSMP